MFLGGTKKLDCEVCSKQRESSKDAARRLITDMLKAAFPNDLSALQSKPGSPEHCGLCYRELKPNEAKNNEFCFDCKKVITHCQKCHRLFRVTNGTRKYWDEHNICLGCSERYPIEKWRSSQEEMAAIQGHSISDWIFARSDVQGVI